MNVFVENNNEKFERKNMEKYENVSMLLLCTVRHSQFVFLRESNHDGVSTERIEG